MVVSALRAYCAVHIEYCVKSVLLAHLNSPIETSKSAFLNLQILKRRAHVFVCACIEHYGVGAIEVGEGDTHAVEPEVCDVFKIRLRHPVVHIHVEKAIHAVKPESVCKRQHHIDLPVLAADVGGNEPTLLHQPTAEIRAVKTYRIALAVHDFHALRLNVSVAFCRIVVACAECKSAKRQYNRQKHKTNFFHNIPLYFLTKNHFNI